MLFATYNGIHTASLPFESNNIRNIPTGTLHLLKFLIKEKFKNAKGILAESQTRTYAQSSTRKIRGILSDNSHIEQLLHLRGRKEYISELMCQCV